MQAVFCKERNWDQFHTPRNVLLALVGEVGELAEILWVQGEYWIMLSCADPPGPFPLEIQTYHINIVKLKLKLSKKASDHQPSPIAPPGKQIVPRILWKNLDPRMVI